MKVIVPLVITVAVASALYQVINWEKVGEEYAPVIEFFQSAAGFIPASQPAPTLNQAPDTVAPVTPAAEPTPSPKVGYMRGAVINLEPSNNSDTKFEISDRPEIKHGQYSELKSYANVCDPVQHKINIREAFANDGVIREDEYYEMIGQCNKWSDDQDVGAKSELKAFARE